MFGCAAGCKLNAPSYRILDPTGAVLYDSLAPPAHDVPTNLLHFPSPAAGGVYVLEDYPRFRVPAWGPAPIPGGVVEPGLAATHGYDFRNNVRGDKYILLLGAGAGGYAAARSAMKDLIGPCPLLPDYAFGTWFTWWHSYTEAEAKQDIEMWEVLGLPIDVWALDMNWRNTSDHQDRYYTHPATQLFANFTEWFAFLQSKRLRTYFNDHPFPVASRGAGGLQTSPEETAFRWSGLSEWMARGLTFWWFDHNWAFSIPPPFINSSVTSRVWAGLDNAAWGSHVYYESVAAFDELRTKAGDEWYGGRPITLTKGMIPDWRPGMLPETAAESPAQHRFPVWWTGDGVPLEGSVQSMVDAGVHGFKPFVHSDCGGDYRGSAGDLLRWTGHCTFGTILRFHGSDHRAWSYDNATVAAVKSYLEMRYALLPSLIAGAAEATRSGFPIAARADLFWPSFADARTNDQYLWLNDTLVAPIFDSASNVSTRDVWIPPGEWHDAWNGSVVSGPATLSITEPYERIPLWHRAGGFALLAADRHATRVDEQDWSTIVIETFPSSERHATHHALIERSTSRHQPGARTELALLSDGAGTVHMHIGAAAVARAWLVRTHLRPGQRVVACRLDGQDVLSGVRAIRASSSGQPFGGAGSAAPAGAGDVVEIELPRGAGMRHVELIVR